MDFRRIGEDDDNIFIAVPKNRPAQAATPAEGPSEVPIEEVDAYVQGGPSSWRQYKDAEAKLMAPAPVREPQQIPIPGIQPITGQGGITMERPVTQKINMAPLDVEGIMPSIPTAPSPRVERPDPKKYSGAASSRLNQGKKAQEQATKSLGQAERDALGEELSANERIQTALQATMGGGLSEDQQRYADQVQEKMDAIQDRLDNLMNPDERQQSLGQRLLTGLSVFMSGVGPGENEVLNMINKERDRRATMLVKNAELLGEQLKGYQQLMGSIRSPKGKMAATQWYLNKMMELQAKDATLRGKLKIAPAKVEMGLAKLQQENAKLQNDVYNAEYGRLATEEKEKYERGYEGLPVGTFVDVKTLNPKDMQRLVRHPVMKDKGLLADTKEGATWAAENLPNYRRLFQILDKFDAYRKKYSGLSAKIRGKLPGKIAGEYDSLRREMLIIAKKADIQSALQQYEIDLINDLYPTDPSAMFSNEDGKIRAARERAEVMAKERLKQHGIAPLSRLYRNQ